MKYQPMVSICCLAYNHEPYIRECLDGFMIQKTDFTFEVLIHDDASTDGTTNIIREYEAKYPDIIKPIYQKENQYSKGVSVSATFNWSRANGKYIAMCEGDDYWIDPLKLQKQVDFLELHPEFNSCFHQFYVLKNNEFKVNFIDNIDKHMFQSSYENGFEFNLTELFSEWFVQTSSIMFRKNIIDFETINRFSKFYDLHLFYYCLEKTNSFYLKDIMSVYRRHDGGVWGGSNLNERSKLHLKIRYELYKISPNEITKRIYKESARNRRVFILKKNIIILFTWKCIKKLNRGINKLKTSFINQ